MKKRNLLVLGAIGVWFLIAAVVFTWFGIQSKAYQEEWQTYTTQVREKFTAATSSEHTPQTLVTLADDLQAIQSPQAPNLLGLSLGADSERAKQARVAQQLAMLQINLRATAVFIDYQQKVAGELGALSLAAAGNEAQIVALAQKWQQTTDAIKSFSPPEPLTGVHMALIQTQQEAQSVILSLADLYKHGDEAAFKARYDQLLTKTSNFKTISNDIKAVATVLDTDRARYITTILQNL